MLTALCCPWGSPGREAGVPAELPAAAPGTWGQQQPQPLLRRAATFSMPPVSPAVRMSPGLGRCCWHRPVPRLCLLNLSSTAAKTNSSSQALLLSSSPLLYPAWIFSGYKNINICLRLIRCAHLSKPAVILNIWHWVLAVEVLHWMQALLHHSWTKPSQTQDWSSCPSVIHIHL